MSTSKLLSRMRFFLIGLLICLLTLVSCASMRSSASGSQSAVNADDPFATATAYATPKQKDNVYSNEEFGISITIPNSDVEATTSEPDSGTFQEYVFTGGAGYGYLYPTGMVSGETLQQVAQSAYESQVGSLEEIELLKDEEISLPNGGKAWDTRFTGYDAENDYSLEVHLITAINSDRAVTFMVYSLPEYFSYFTAAEKAMVNSIKLFTPTVLGMPRSQVLVLEGGESSNARENDPATTHGSSDYLVFEGLVTYNEQMEVVPALAASWDVSMDGTVYTFHIQPDAVFHNGKPVTAEDVVYSWERAADPETDSDTVMTYLSDIVGVKEMHEGSADSISGLQVIDEHTLQVTIDAPKPYFLYKLIYSTANVLDRENVETGEDWYRTPNGTGPYRLVRWDSMERMIYERFEEYYGTKPDIQRIVYTLYSGDEFRLYEEGSVDIAGVADYNAERVSDPSEPLNKELVTGVSLCTTYVQFDVSQAPFDDAKVRQAFALAFDKSKYLEVALKNTDVLAKGLYPPALPGYNLDLEGYGYDPELARQLIAESSYGSVDAFPEIIFTSSGYGGYADSLVAAMSQMWQQNLGVTITVQNLDPERYLDEEVTEEYGQLSTTGWCADYPDPENFADVLFHTGSEMNNGNYSNPELDAILEEARVEPDVNKRIDLYQQAEEIIVKDAAAIFLYHSTSYVVVKPYIEGYVLPLISTYPLIRYLSIDQTYWQ